MLNRILCALLAFCLCLSLVGCGASSKPETEPPTTQTETTEPSMTMEEYSELVSGAWKSLYENAVAINNVMIFEHTYWKTYKKIGGTTVDEESMVDHAIETFAKKSEKDYTRQWFEDAFAADSQKYKEIIATKVPEGAEKIAEEYENFFDAYLGLYRLTFEPGSSFSSFESQGNEFLGAIQNANAKLEVLLSD